MVGSFPELSETFILDQITGLVELGHSVSIFAERGPSGTEVHPDVERFGLRRVTRYELLPSRFAERLRRWPQVWRPTLPHFRALDVLRFGRDAASLRLVWSASLVDGAGQFDIIQCHFGALGRKAVLLRDIGALRGKIVTAFHGEDVTTYPRRFSGNVYAPLFARGDLFLPVSERWNDALVSLGCPPKRIRVHHMGVGLRNFAPPPPDAPRLAAPRIVTVARLVEKKGIADAIRAVAGINANCEYVIVGDGPLRMELEELARAEGVADRVRFIGPRQRREIADLLRSATLFLAPSVTARDGDIEGIPVSIMEAMASALPVVSTRHSAIPELVADGASGFLVAEHDVGALRERLLLLISNAELCARMGAAGRRIVERDFDVDVLTSRLERTYQELVDGGGARN